MTIEGFSSPTVCALTGVPPSTLNYWVSTKVVRPSIRGRSGKRATQWWRLQDLIAVRAVKALRDAGCPLQTLRRVQDILESGWQEALGDAVLHWDGVDVLKVGPLGELQSVLRHPGQGVLHFVALPVGSWRIAFAPHAHEIDVHRLERLDEARRRRRAS